MRKQSCVTYLKKSSDYIPSLIYNALHQTLFMMGTGSINSIQSEEIKQD